MKTDYDAIANILTLRYNPARPLTRPLSKVHFMPVRADFGDAESGLLSIIERDLAKLKARKATVLLSGGVDSIFTLVMLKTFRPDVKVSCVSMGFGDADDEVGYAHNVASAFDCDFDAVIKDDVLSELPLLIGMSREPRWNLYQYYALELARAKSRIIFSGDGGDELFGGYTFRYQKYLSLLPKKNIWKERIRLYLSCHERDWVPDQEKMFGPKVRFSWDRIYSLLRKYFDNKLAPLDQVFLADYNGKLLYDWIPANTAFAKALDAKIMSLFLSRRITAFATHLPWRLKYCPETAMGKLLLRSLLKRQGITAEPIKKGFSIDTIALWNRDTLGIIENYVNPDSLIVQEGVISREWVQKTCARLKANRDIRYINKMFGILALEVWWRLFVNRSMRMDDKL